MNKRKMNKRKMNNCKLKVTLIRFQGLIKILVSATVMIQLSGTFQPDRNQKGVSVSISSLPDFCISMLILFLPDSIRRRKIWVL
ncbi:hypothetical protein DU80_04460 [Methanosarcina mazei]|uniref:Uncharacterized protein n=1 Tax=Methanosarcina mazei TaxID=2209 RepID=A0A0F8MQT5_METMZ|nr:hypothetical protein DU31_07380 [Methanosarcina mazei]KKG00622.1 hypothetical protein DU40_10065 [Methanosarcina mazei]KKG04593.1 hypothetical protein DU47_00260 [Methanosarcina mazei]KKG09934.1 hypothetical protein DU34_12485 [Methanosarcina mazei]KKG30787.1 hypothetical protein DU49_11905 [Methanosarcina mazei]